MDTVRETTVKEAATVLGLSPEGVRKRLQRGTLSGRKAGTSWTVFLPAGPRMQDTSTGDVQDVGQDAGLLAHLQGEIAYLREELQRKDAIIMQMAQKPLQLPAPETVATGGGQRPWWQFWRRV